MALNKSFAQFELADGTVSDEIRIIFADKVQLERTARAERWDMEKDFTKVNSLLTWAAAKRSGAIPEDWSYQTFVANVVDLAIEKAGDVDPTQTDQQSSY